MSLLSVCVCHYYQFVCHYNQCVCVITISVFAITISVFVSLLSVYFCHYYQCVCVITISVFVPLLSMCLSLLSVCLCHYYQCEFHEQIIHLRPQESMSLHDVSAMGFSLSRQTSSAKTEKIPCSLSREQVTMRRFFPLAHSVEHCSKT